MECLRADQGFGGCIAAPLGSVGRRPQSLLGAERTSPQGTQGKFQLVVCIAAHRVHTGSVTLIAPQIQLAEPSVASAAPKLMANANIGHH